MSNYTPICRQLFCLRLRLQVWAHQLDITLCVSSNLLKAQWYLSKVFATPISAKNVFAKLFQFSGCLHHQYAVHLTL